MHFRELQPRLSEALVAGSGFIEREYGLRKNGDPPILVDLTVTPSGTGKKFGLLIELTTLDRHFKTARDEWMASQYDASRQLIRGLAHEIKNPLGGIRGAAQLMEGEFNDPEQREYTQVIIREADRLQNLVNRMLGPNRLPNHSSMNIHEVLEHVRTLVEAEAGDSIQFIRDYDPSIPDLIADREQLIQAVLNIARNAMQALSESTTKDKVITLRSRTRRRYTVGGVLHKLVAQVDIEDNGPGIPPEFRDKVFYPMVTTRAQGSGLGLPISQYLVHGHHGLIECESAPGKTVFSIFLPLDFGKHES